MAFALNRLASWVGPFPRHSPPAGMTKGVGHGLGPTSFGHPGARPALQRRAEEFDASALWALGEMWQTNALLTGSAEPLLKQPVAGMRGMAHAEALIPAPSLTRPVTGVRWTSPPQLRDLYGGCVNTAMVRASTSSSASSCSRTFLTKLQ